jgi:hypothetical protein
MRVLQGDGTNEHGGNGVPIGQEAIHIPAMCQARGKHKEIQTMSQSERWRFVTLVGRIKETAHEMRKIHACLAESMDRVTAADSPYQFCMASDMKNVSIMTGHLGAGARNPCTHCIRPREDIVSCHHLPTLTA